MPTVTSTAGLYLHLDRLSVVESGQARPAAFDPELPVATGSHRPKAGVRLRRFIATTDQHPIGLITNSHGAPWSYPAQTGRLVCTG